jgi:hypothetical protein
VQALAPLLVRAENICWYRQIFLKNIAGQRSIIKVLAYNYYKLPIKEEVMQKTKMIQVLRRLVGNLAGIDPGDSDFEGKVDRLIYCEDKFPDFAQTITKLVRGKIHQKYPIDADLLMKAAHYQALQLLEDEGLGLGYLSEISQMELESDHRDWGGVRTYAHDCKETQVIFSNFMKKGTRSLMKRVMTSARSSR